VLDGSLTEDSGAHDQDVHPSARPGSSQEAHLLSHAAQSPARACLQASGLTHTGHRVRSAREGPSREEAARPRCVRLHHGGRPPASQETQVRATLGRWRVRPRSPPPRASARLAGGGGCTLQPLPSPGCVLSPMLPASSRHRSARRAALRTPQPRDAPARHGAARRRMNKRKERAARQLASRVPSQASAIHGVRPLTPLPLSVLHILPLPQLARALGSRRQRLRHRQP
jgi:hypothetical protein